jgi:Sulfotransferase family
VAAAPPRGGRAAGRGLTGIRDSRLKLRAGARLLAGRLAGRTRRERAAPEAALRDEAGLEGRLAWLMGSPRAGTTWLLRLLVHPWILASRRASGIVRPIATSRAELPNVVPINETFLPLHLLPLTPGSEPRDGSGARAPSLAEARAGEPAYFFSDEFAEAWRPELRRLVLARLGAQAELAAEAHALADPVVLIKEPNGSHGAELVMSLLPAARLLFVVRDGRDVVDSLLDAERSWAAAAGPAPDRIASVRRHAWHWLTFTSAVQRAYESRPPELRYIVRYEDLRASPVESLRPILGWLGLRDDEARARDAVDANAFESLPGFMKGAGTPRRAATPGLWRTNLSPPEQDAMREIIGDKLAELGYEP